MSAFIADLLVGKDMHAAAKLATSKAPGTWAESFPGEPYGVRVENKSSGEVRALVIVDGKSLQRIRMPPNTSYVFSSMLSEIKGDIEYRLPLVFGTPVVEEKRDGEEARIDGPDTSAAAKLGIVRVQFSAGYHRPAPAVRGKCERCVARTPCCFLEQDKPCRVVWRADPMHAGAILVVVNI